MNISRLASTLPCGLLILFLSCGSWLWGQTPDESVTELGSGKQPHRERTIYVPFAKLREVFEREGRGVFLPYDQFQQMWEAARSAHESHPTATPPIDSIITVANSQATVRADVVRVDATLSIELLKQGWNTVPLRLAGSAIQSATIDGEVARITSAADGYQLLVENTTDQPRQIELKLRYARAFQKSPGQNSVVFAAPQSPVNRWTIRVPQAGVKISVEPMIAATEDLASTETDVAPVAANADAADIGEVDPGASTDAATDPDSVPQTSPHTAEETVLLAFVGSTPEVTISWTPKSEGATGLAALVSVQAQQEMFVSEGAVRTRATLTYTISRSQLERLVVDVPVDHKVVSVFDPNVRKWDVQSSEAADAVGTESHEVQRVVVELFEPAQTTQQLTIELERYIDPSQFDELRTPVIRAVEVGRQQGIVAIRVDPALRAESTSRSGLLQMDKAELPAALAQQEWTFAYRYAALPFELVIAAEKIQPRITVEQLVEYYLQPHEIFLDVLSIYTIEQAGVFQLEFELPSGYEVVRVRGLETSGANAAAVDSFHTDESDSARLIVNLSQKAIGKTGLLVQLRQSVNDPNLSTPTGSASTVVLPIPGGIQPFTDRFGGNVVVYSPESLRLNPLASTGLKAIAMSKAFQTIASCRDDRFSMTRPTLAYSFSDQPTRLEISAERRSPYITARQMMVVRVEPGVVKYESILFFDILYSPVDSLRIDVPKVFAGEIRNASGPIRDAVMEPQPDDVAEDYTAWKLTGETELIGSQQVHLTWEQQMSELPIGSSQDLQVPRILPMGTDRAWGQVVVTRSESLNVEASEETEGLRPIDPVYDVMPDVRIADAARAFEFYGDWNLTLTTTRYQLEQVKHTSIERALVRAVVTRSNLRSFQALYRVRSARQRLSLKLPADAEFGTQPARVNGSPVSLERGQQDVLYIPLIGQDPNADFLLELRYTLPGGQQQIDVPAFPEDPAIQKVYLAVFLPEELSLLHKSGPWTEEFDWRPGRGFKWTPAANTSDDELARWVAEDLHATVGPSFQTDGQLYLYSALRPDPPPLGSLKLTAVHKHVLSGLVIVVLAAIGLMLLRSPIAAKIVALALLLMVAVLCGVFAPTLGQQLLNLPMLAGLALVGIAWTARGCTIALARMNWRHVPFFSKSQPISKPHQDDSRTKEVRDEPSSISPESPKTSEGELPADDLEAREGEQHE